MTTRAFSLSRLPVGSSPTAAAEVAWRLWTTPRRFARPPRERRFLDGVGPLLIGDGTLFRLGITGCLGLCGFATGASDAHRHGDVFQSGELWQQMMILINEAHVRATQLRSSISISCAHIEVVNQYRAGIGGIQSGKDVQ